MRKPLALTAYLALRQTTGRGATTPRPDRPLGTLVWIHCEAPERLNAVQALADLLTEDGDPITVLATTSGGPDFPDLIVQSIPNETPADAKAFLEHWTPDALIWLDGTLRPALITQAAERRVPSTVLDVTETRPDVPANTRVPGLGRAVLGLFDRAMSVDQRGTARLARAGLKRGAIRRVERFDAGNNVLPCHEAERAELAEAFATRPAWLAAGVPENELPLMITAYRLASQRRHRLVMILACDEALVGTAKQLFSEAGLSVCDYLEGSMPDDGTQVIVTDTEGLGLWYRLAPLTYLGGTLRGGQKLDPFDAASLGSVVIHGLKTSAHQYRFEQLGRAAACRMVQSETELGRVVETLLSPDRAAAMAHAAWDVTSRGAETGRLVAEMVRADLDAAGA